MANNKWIRILSFARDYGKLLVVWVILHVFRRELLKQHIWLIREKRDEARDNGYHFFRYVRENHPDVNAYFVITPDSPDRHKVEKYGNLIDADSWEHCIYFLAAEYSINSQLHGAYPFRFNSRMMNYVQKLCNRKQKVVFLQHGIMANRLSAAAFHFDLCNIDYFVTSTKREYEFVKETYKYTNNAIGCVGMARLDYLYAPHQVKRQVLVMPTWRSWLYDNQAADSAERQNIFCCSDYFCAYAEMLSDKELIEKLRRQDYKLIFYPHYSMQPYVELFKKFENDVVVVAEKTNYDVQDLLMTSSMMVTDYSSVFFDFAYMDKPLVYYQFDKQRFRESHYAEGYFSYERDGFGPCCEDFESVKEYIFEMIDKECQQPEIYAQRVNAFFTLRDNRNCERTYNAIIALNE